MWSTPSLQYFYRFIASNFPRAFLRCLAMNEKFNTSGPAVLAEPILPSSSSQPSYHILLYHPTALRKGPKRSWLKLNSDQSCPIPWEAAQSIEVLLLSISMESPRQSCLAQQVKLHHRQALQSSTHQGFIKTIWKKSNKIFDVERKKN